MECTAHSAEGWNNADHYPLSFKRAKGIKFQGEIDFSTSSQSENIVHAEDMNRLMWTVAHRMVAQLGEAPGDMCTRTPESRCELNLGQPTPPPPSAFLRRRWIGARPVWE